MRAEAMALPRTTERTVVWPALACATAAAAVIPFWTSSVLPFQDAPLHLASVRVLADYHSMGFDRYFVIDLRRLQYLGFYLPAAALAKVFGAEAACRALLTLVALALPASMWLLLGAFGRDRRLAIFAPALVHTMPLYMGFFNFIESVPAAIAVVALTERQLREPSRKRAVLIAVSSALLLWLHPAGLLFTLGTAAVLTVTARRPLRALLPFVPAFGLFCAWGASALSVAGAGSFGWLPWHMRVRDLLQYGDVLRTGADEMFVAWMVGLFLAVAILGSVPLRNGAFRLPLLAALCLAAYFVAPFERGYMAWIAHRALPFAAALALASVQLSPRRATPVLLACAALLQIAYFAKLTAAYDAFDEEAQVSDLRLALDGAAPGQRLVGQIRDQESSVFRYRPYMHFGAYYELLRGGRTVYNFAETPWTPVRFRPGTEPALMPNGWEWRPLEVDEAKLARDEDYLLVRGSGPAPRAPWSLRGQFGRWSLYRSR